jgi:hypothetical protein
MLHHRRERSRRRERPRLRHVPSLVHVNQFRVAVEFLGVVVPAGAVAADEAARPRRQRVAEGVAVVAERDGARGVGRGEDAPHLVEVEPPVGAGVGRRVGRRVAQDVADDAGAERVVLDRHGVREPDVVDIEVFGVGVDGHAEDAQQGFAGVGRREIGLQVALDPMPCPVGDGIATEKRDGRRGARPVIRRDGRVAGPLVAQRTATSDLPVGGLDGNDELRRADGFDPRAEGSHAVDVVVPRAGARGTLPVMRPVAAGDLDDVGAARDVVNRRHRRGMAPFRGGFRAVEPRGEGEGLVARRTEPKIVETEVAAAHGESAHFRDREAGRHALQVGLKITFDGMPLSVGRGGAERGHQIAAVGAAPVSGPVGQIAFLAARASDDHVEDGGLVGFELPSDGFAFGIGPGDVAGVLVPGALALAQEPSVSEFEGARGGQVQRLAGEAEDVRPAFEGPVVFDREMGAGGKRVVATPFVDGVAGAFVDGCARLTGGVSAGDGLFLDLLGQPVEEVSRAGAVVDLLEDSASEGIVGEFDDVALAGFGPDETVRLVPFVGPVEGRSRGAGGHVALVVEGVGDGSGVLSSFMEVAGTGEELVAIAVSEGGRFVDALIVPEGHGDAVAGGVVGVLAFAFDDPMSCSVGDGIATEKRNGVLSKCILLQLKTMCLYFDVSLFENTNQSFQTVKASPRKEGVGRRPVNDLVPSREAEGFRHAVGNPRQHGVGVYEVGEMAETRRRKTLDKGLEEKREEFRSSHARSRSFLEGSPGPNGDDRSPGAAPLSGFLQKQGKGKSFKKF